MEVYDMTTKIYSIEDIKQMLNEILTNTEVEKAILFGSYAKNTPTTYSDIDILIDSNGKIKGLKFFAIIDMIREKFNKDVDVIEENADFVECDFYWVYPNKKKEDVGYIYKNKKEMLTYARVVAWNKLIKRDIIKEKFDKDVDVIERMEIDKNSKIEKEIEKTGVVVYEK